jgi:hypothetical protein
MVAAIDGPGNIFLSGMTTCHQDETDQYETGKAASGGPRVQQRAHNLF